jgi:hypothetical protein
VADDPQSLFVPGEPDPDGAPTASESVSQAVLRFRSCRWRRPPEEGGPEHCTHRDVLPFAGAGGFDPEAWCPTCTYYKQRRTPRKRQDNEYRY